MTLLKVLREESQASEPDAAMLTAPWESISSGSIQTKNKPDGILSELLSFGLYDLSTMIPSKCETLRPSIRNRSLIRVV